MAPKKPKSTVEVIRNEQEEQELAMLANSTDPHVIEIQRKITSVFDLFDKSGKRTVDVREVGSIIRSLGNLDFLSSLGISSRLLTP